MHTKYIHYEYAFYQESLKMMVWLVNCDDMKAVVEFEKVNP